MIQGGWQDKKIVDESGRSIEQGHRHNGEVNNVMWRPTVQERCYCKREEANDTSVAKTTLKTTHGSFFIWLLYFFTQNYLSHTHVI